MTIMSNRRNPGPVAFTELFEGFVSAVLPCDVSDTAKRKLQGLARFVHAGGGENPFSDCDRDELVFVARGATKLVAHVSQGREQVVAFHFAGDLVSVPARGAHAYSLCALENCDLVIFPLNEFLELARREGIVIEALLGRALQALARSREKSVTLGRKTAQERVASFLVTMAKRIGSPRENGCVLDLPMSRRDVADSLGLTIETISRQLGELRDARLLETSGRSVIRLLDLQALDLRAGHLPAAA